MSESHELVVNRREYSRVDAYIPLEYRRINKEEQEQIKSRISGEVMLANFNLMPPLENHPQMECLSLLNKKLDTIIQMMALQSEGFHSLPFNQRMVEMEKFYLLMEIHFNSFLTAWTKERKKIYK